MSRAATRAAESCMMLKPVHPSRTTSAFSTSLCTLCSTASLSPRASTPAPTTTMGRAAPLKRFRKSLLGLSRASSASAPSPSCSAG